MPSHYRVFTPDGALLLTISTFGTGRKDLCEELAARTPAFVNARHAWRMADGRLYILDANGGILAYAIKVTPNH